MKYLLKFDTTKEYKDAEKGDMYVAYVEEGDGTLYFNGNKVVSESAVDEINENLNKLNTAFSTLDGKTVIVDD